MNEITGTVIFIDDEENSRFIYGAILEEIYGKEFVVETLEPGVVIDEMVATIRGYNDIVSIVIDEKLQVGVGTNYKGSDLVQAIREYDPKIPLYILTSEMGLIDPPFGSVEYIIDKGRIGEDAYKLECSILMRRHINSFNDIKTARMARFDELLRKSLVAELSDDEIGEYNELDLWRMRKVMAAEPLTPSHELDEHENLLKQIEEEIKKATGNT